MENKKGHPIRWSFVDGYEYSRRFSFRGFHCYGLSIDFNIEIYHPWIEAIALDHHIRLTSAPPGKDGGPVLRSISARCSALAPITYSASKPNLPSIEAITLNHHIWLTSASPGKDGGQGEGRRASQLRVLPSPGAR